MDSAQTALCLWEESKGGARSDGAERALSRFRKHASRTQTGYSFLSTPALRRIRRHPHPPSSKNWHIEGLSGLLCIEQSVLPSSPVFKYAQSVRSCQSPYGDGTARFSFSRSYISVPAARKNAASASVNSIITPSRQQALVQLWQPGAGSSLFLRSKNLNMLFRGCGAHLPAAFAAHSETSAYQRLCGCAVNSAPVSGPVPAVGQKLKLRTPVPPVIRFPSLFQTGLSRV